MPHIAPVASCGPGLLCEDPVLLNGFRVPRGCVVTHRGRWLSQCELHDIAPDGMQLREFVATRYGTVRWQSPGVLWAEDPKLGTLQATILGNHAHIAVIPAAVGSALDTTPTGR